MTMIEESKKGDNQKFGQEIIKAASEVRDKREAKNIKKNFVSEHAQTIKKWNQNKVDEAMQRRMVADYKKS